MIIVTDLHLFFVKVFLYLHDGMNPVQHFFHAAVNARSSLSGAADPPAHHSNQMPLRRFKVHQRAPTIPLQKNDRF